MRTDQSRRKQAAWRKRREVQVAIAQDVALDLRIAGHEFALQIQLTHEVPHRSRKSRALRPGLKHKSVSSYCRDHAAGTCRCFQQHRLNTQLTQAKCRRE